MLKLAHHGLSLFGCWVCFLGEPWSSQREQGEDNGQLTMFSPGVVRVECGAFQEAALCEWWLLTLGQRCHCFHAAVGESTSLLG